MATWAEMQKDAPEVESVGRALLYQHGVGLAYLATVAADGSPRLHPVCPLLYGDGMYVFVIPSPKQWDLHRDGRFALHSYPRPDDEDAFFVGGRARLVTDPALRRALSDQFVAERVRFSVPAPEDDHDLFEFDISRCLVTTSSGHGDQAPNKLVWRPAEPPADHPAPQGES
jgi:hypothetical protein